MRPKAKAAVTRCLATLLVGLLATGCTMAAGQSEPTPTIVPVSVETRAAILTAEAARLVGGATVTPTAEASATPEPSGLTDAATPAAEVTASMPAEATAMASSAAAPETPAAPPQPTGTPAAAVALPTEHVVRWGEHLTSIARRYGVTVRDLVQANGIDNPSAIYVGQVLAVPAPGTPSTPAPAAAPATTVPAPAAAATPVTPTATPRPSRIAFQVASGGEIWAVNEDGSGLVRLTHGLDPAWSPDGTRLAFVRWDEPRGLYVFDTTTGQEWRVRGGNLMKSPTWNPDGDQIAFAWETSGASASRVCFPGFGCVDLPGRPTWSLTVVDLQGNTADLPADERSFSPSWSATGETVVYQGERALKGTSFGGEPWVILDDVAAAFPVVSPDGSRILFMYRQHDHWEVYVVGTNGSGLKRLTESSPLADRAANNVAPAWSPDGERVLFLSDRDGRWRPYVMGADGSNQEPFLPEVLDQLAFTYEFAAERVFSWQ